MKFCDGVVLTYYCQPPSSLYISSEHDATRNFRPCCFGSMRKHHSGTSLQCMDIRILGIMYPQVVDIEFLTLYVYIATPINRIPRYKSATNMYYNFEKY